MEDKIFLVGIPRSNGKMPTIEKMIGPTGDPIIFFNKDSADTFCEEKSNEDGYGYGVFSATIQINAMEIKLKL